MNLAKHAGLPWDAILGAEIARAYKPDPRVYVASADALGLDPHEVCMVAAHNSDLQAAQALGFGPPSSPAPPSTARTRPPTSTPRATTTSSPGTSSTLRNICI